jgi:hypothetical protein
MVIFMFIFFSLCNMTNNSVYINDVCLIVACGTYFYLMPIVCINL